MKVSVIAKIVGGGGKTLSYLLTVFLAIGAAARVQAAVNWTGASDNRFSNTANYSSYTWNFVFNNATAARTLVYLDQNYSGKIKFNNDAEKYRGLIFRAHPPTHRGISAGGMAAASTPTTIRADPTKRSSTSAMLTRAASCVFRRFRSPRGPTKSGAPIIRLPGMS